MYMSVQRSRLVYYTAVSLVLFFLPILVMTTAYSFIAWRLWSKRCPGERVGDGAAAQTKVRRKVSDGPEMATMPR